MVKKKRRAKKRLSYEDLVAQSKVVRKAIIVTGMRGSPRARARNLAEVTRRLHLKIVSSPGFLRDLVFAYREGILVAQLAKLGLILTQPTRVRWGKKENRLIWHSLPPEVRHHFPQWVNPQIVRFTPPKKGRIGVLSRSLAERVQTEGRIKKLTRRQRSAKLCLREPGVISLVMKKRSR